MCYYYGQKVTRAEFIRLKELEKAVLRYEFLDRDLQIGFDYSQCAVIVPKAGVRDFDVVEMEWGFIPPYWKNREIVANNRNGYKDGNGRFVQYLTLNATAEELLLPRKMYRDAALKRRCLVLSSGIFEWRHVYPLNKRTGVPIKTATKYPYHITVKNQPYFFMAGIWQPWTDESTGEIVNTFSVITTEANELMAQVHNSKKRMPAILDEDLAYEWIFGDLTEQRISEIARTKFPANQMEACPVAKDFRAKLEPAEPFEYEDLPALELSL